MSGIVAEVSTVARYAAIGLLATLILAPCIAVVWKGTNMRRGLWRAGCWRWVICCDRVFGEGVDRANASGARTVAEHYELMFAEQAPRRSLGLRLASWRENVRHHTADGLTTVRLGDICVKTERMERGEPLIELRRGEDETIPTQEPSRGGSACVSPTNERWVVAAEESKGDDM